ncbi:heterokaryon incompatibility protein-domain-containing protein [Nemania sp. FL0916]|nr:heterokaryon incompatibility protein-domain-containing protein [Nemania sp. FL0916]
MSTFTYQQLDLNSAAFRLVRLLKGTSGTNIECELIYTTLDDNVIPYEAVSYTWGELQKPHSIKLQGQKFMVTSNLWYLLGNIRRAESDRYLWIDAIAINQEDDSERSHQVQRMQTIYSRADCVLFYLGEDTVSISILMESLIELQYLQRRRPNNRWAVNDERWATTWKEVRRKVLLPDNSHVEEPLKLALTELLKRPWFRRVWILQEVASARKALVCCGANSVRVQTFTMAPTLIGVDLAEHVAAVFRLMPTTLGEVSRERRDRTLSSVLLDFRWSQASDPRDRIFALLGLCDGHNAEHGIVPDYHMSENDVVWTTIRYILVENVHLQQSSLDIDQPLTVDQFLSDLLRSSTGYVEKLLVRAFTSWEIKAVRSLLSRREKPVMITIQMVSVAACRKIHAMDMMVLLLQYGTFKGLPRQILTEYTGTSALCTVFIGRFRAAIETSIVCLGSVDVPDEQYLYYLILLAEEAQVNELIHIMITSDEKTEMLIKSLRTKVRNKLQSSDGGWTPPYQREIKPATDNPDQPQLKEKNPLWPRYTYETKGSPRRVLSRWPPIHWRNILLPSHKYWALGLKEVAAWNLVFMGVCSGEIEIVKLLLDVKPEILNDYRNASTALGYAVALYHNSIANYLLGKGVKEGYGRKDQLSGKLSSHHNIASLSIFL